MDKMENVDAMLKRLDEQRDAYLVNHSLVREMLAPASPPPVSSARDVLPPTSPARESQTTLPGSAWRKSSLGLESLLTSSASRATGEDSDDEEGGEEYYVQTPLEQQEYDHEGLRHHLRSYKWTHDSSTLLQGVVNNTEFLSKATLFPTHDGAPSDRSHYSHHQVFNVDGDGVPMAVELPEDETLPSNALVIWHTIKDVNNNSSKEERTAVGRISILQEPSPILFGAIHYTMHHHFDVDELFKHLLDSEGSSASLGRIYDDDDRRRRSFVFNFEYFTIIGDECQPMPWQLADRQEERSPHHIAITRCSSVVALSLGGKHIKKLKSRSRRAKGKYGFVHDPFAPWQVLNIQCYADWKSSLDIHDSTRHYVNGVEAFMVSILGEFKDAERRFESIYQKITKLVTPPLDFMFDSEVRERLLFEDAGFTYVRRYFWAAQTLGIINDSIKAMVDTYEDNFTDEVWSGTHKTVWPLEEENRPRNVYFKKKMKALRQKFDAQILRLRKLVNEIDDRRAEIKNLREELFVGTSIQESRKSVENSDITVQQGHNIKILTMVSIFFLPLTFVTSVFGMTNMPTDEHYWQFGIVTATVCVPFFILVGSLNSTRGLHFWRHKVAVVFIAVGTFLAWVGSCGWRRKPAAQEDSELDDEKVSHHVPITKTTSSTRDHRTARKRMRHPSIGCNRDTGKPGAEVVETQQTLECRRPALTSPTAESSRLADMMLSEVERKRTITYSAEV